jgi:hypothetical protein
VKVLRPGDIRRIQERHALVIAGNAPPIIATLRRSLDGKDGEVLQAELEQARARVVASRAQTSRSPSALRAAVAYARTLRLTPSNPDLADTAASPGEPAGEWTW